VAEEPLTAHHVSFPRVFIIMDFQKPGDTLCGCYVTVTTRFHDDELELNLEAAAREILIACETPGVIRD
tara:strand:- start:232 stop:438 length:207 start_codon:yes stop_codon:yes gene_type:complete